LCTVTPINIGGACFLAVNASGRDDEERVRLSSQA
jgi:hypothetical protein